MKKNYEQMAEQIIACSGGGNNFLTVTNCATRVRVTYKNMDAVQIDEMKKIEGVLSVIVNDAVQIVVGPGACNKIAGIIQDKLNVPEDPEIAGTDSGTTAVKKKKINIFRIFSDIFVPILPAMIAGGVLQGLNNVLKNYAVSKAAGAGIQAIGDLTAAQVWLQNYHLLDLSNIIGVIYAAVFSFLAIYVGYNAAKQFKVEPVLGAVLGCITLQGTLTTLGSTAGQGGLIGVILGVFVMSYIQKAVKKIVPNAVDVVITPVLTMLIITVLMVKIFMPVCGVLSTAIVNGLMWLLNTTGPFGGFVLSALAPLLISTGLHQGLTAVHMEMINSLGRAPLLAVQVMSNAGMVGASCAIYLMTKQKAVKDACKGAIPTSFLCVGEPVIYGVCLPSGFGFITGSIGAGVGGFFIRLFDVSFSSMGMAGMSAIPLAADGKYLQYIISYFIGAAAAFLLTLVVGRAKHYQ
ncbi:PTS transporter subunit EIIC [Clostridium sp. Marseille-P2415]|uniref:PTS transporter subunit EIIC n=1 Tax=Clostridium sp. Marseille-P2415 TaxID=1805471 RepID=UPI00190E8163|nr:PTS transporter subunit EIIC [Clostridium sp. Marseille-P2415]